MNERSERPRGRFLLPRRDPARSSDPRVRALLAKLAQLPPAPAPRAEFRDELRTQLVAVAPRLVTEVRPEVPARPERTTRAPAGAGSLLRRLAGVRVGRPVAAVLGVLCVFALLLGGAVWISGKAMPGDTLYTVKRATENARLALAGSDTEKAKDYLSFATTRASEVAKLLDLPTAAAVGAGSTAAGTVSAHTAKLVDSTLDSADGDVRSASRLLTGKAVDERSVEPLSIMIDWAPAQLSRLRDIAARLPPGAVLERVRSSRQLVQAALARAEQLRGGIGCACLAGAPSDQLGPVPCTVCTPSVPVAGPTPSAPPPGSTVHRPAAPGTPRTGSTTPQPAHPSGTHSRSHSSAGTGPGAAPANTSSSRSSSRQAGSSTPSPRAGAGGATGAGAGPATGGAAESSAPPGPGAPSSAPASPTPTRTCLIVLLGLCI